MGDDPQLTAFLLERGLVTPPMIAHARALAAAERLGDRQLGLLLVDLGYLDEDALAGAIAEVTGARRWDGVTFDAGSARTVRRRDLLVLARDGRTLHYATLDPRDQDAADALRLETGARELVPWVATRTALWRATLRLREAEAPDAEARADAPRAGPPAADAATDAHLQEDGPLVRLVNLLLIDTAQHGALRLVAGDGRLDAQHGRPLTPMVPAPPAMLGLPIVRRLRHMAGMPEGHTAPRERGTIRLVFGRGQLVDFDVFRAQTEAGVALLLERRASPLAVRAELATAAEAVSTARGRGAREQALRAFVAAADALGPGAALSQIQARQELAGHLAEGHRLGEAAEIAREALPLCDATAPSERVAVEALVVGSLARAERARAWERLADRASRHVSVLRVAMLLEEALDSLDGAERPADAERIATRIESLELQGFGAPSFSTLDALVVLAGARAAVGDPAAEALAARASALAERLLGPDVAVGVADRILGRVRAAQGRTDEAERLLRSALGAYGRAGNERGRWAAAVELARLLPPEQAPEIRDLCDAALASGQLSLEAREDAEALLARFGVPAPPYR